MADNKTSLRWINTGIICGFLVSVIYPSLQFITNILLGVIMTSAMGILLSLASVGLYYFIQIHKKASLPKSHYFRTSLRVHYSPRCFWFSLL